MIYFLLLLSLTANGILIWYIKTLIKKHVYDVEAIDKFSDMIRQYADSLSSIYKLEELYGDENLKKAIVQTKFVIEACTEITGGFTNEQESEETEERENRANEPFIRINEGEKITQNASSYKRIIINQ